jgi:hypothetical protein
MPQREATNVSPSPIVVLSSQIRSRLVELTQKIQGGLSGYESRQQRFNGKPASDRESATAPAIAAQKVFIAPLHRVLLTLVLKAYDTHRPIVFCPLEKKCAAIASGGISTLDALTLNPRRYVFVLVPGQNGRVALVEGLSMQVITQGRTNDPP